MSFEHMHNLEQAQMGLVKEFQDHQKTKAELKAAKERIATLEEHLRQAYVVIEALNGKLSLPQ